MSATRIRRHAVEAAGWEPGTTLENTVAYAMHRWGWRPGGTLSGVGRSAVHDYYAVAQQYRVGPYRLDFAWPDSKLAIEADGWFHRSPEGAARDAERDSWLRAEDWLVFRVDDRHGAEALESQLAWALQAIGVILKHRWRR